MAKYAGEFTYSDPGSDTPIQVGGTMQCVHCGAHWTVIPGSGKKRGWCMRCNGPFCGAQCEACVPVEQRLENEAAGRPLDFRPIIG